MKNHWGCMLETRCCRNTKDMLLGPPLRRTRNRLISLVIFIFTISECFLYQCFCIICIINTRLVLKNRFTVGEFHQCSSHTGFSWHLYHRVALYQHHYLVVTENTHANKHARAHTHAHNAVTMCTCL